MPRSMAARSYCSAPFDFPDAIPASCWSSCAKGVRVFRHQPQSAGCSTPRPRFSAFTREVTFEGQAAMWLEQTLRGLAANTDLYPVSVPLTENSTFASLLSAVVQDRLKGRDRRRRIARAFQRGVAQGLALIASRSQLRHTLDLIRLCFPGESSRTSCCLKI